jgi:spore coat protein CotH
MKIYILIILTVLALNSCYKDIIIVAGEGLDDWTAETHSSSAVADYDIVFDQSKVHRMDIVISENNWSIMQSNLESILGSSGTGPGGGPGGGFKVEFSDETPMYIPCDIFYNEKQWYNVGIRYKGNSSLSSSYTQGIDKLPLRLEFNHFEDDFPSIKGQTFYGFQQISLANNFDDLSLMREKIANDLFREFGVPAPYTAYYEIYIDYGEGSVYFGLYTFTEIVFDTLLEKQFGTNTGNCYKPENDGATFSFSLFNTADFEKKTNKTSSWEDVTAMYDALHSDNRLNNITAWQTELEEVFNVDGFLKYLAVNSVIQNWDVYGNMPHNYYLYNNPSDNRLNWIPWDNNEAFQNGKMTVYDLDYDRINENSWPLIPFILGVAEYEQTYKDYISAFINGAFEPNKMQDQYNINKSLIEAYVDAEHSSYTFLYNSSDFDNEVDALINHCFNRYTIALNYINE